MKAAVKEEPNTVKLPEGGDAGQQNHQKGCNIQMPLGSDWYCLNTLQEFRKSTFANKFQKAQKLFS
jgi:hypothetical protein